MGSLLSVDLGIKTGLALYGQDGRLCWYRSKNYGSAARLKRDIHSLLESISDLMLMVLEGGGTLVVPWEREAARRHVPVKLVQAEQWRPKFLYPREQLTGLKAKQHADSIARKIIAWSGLPRPTSLRHDAAEAVLIGMWAVIDAGWIKELPHEIRRGNLF
ncbi:MAG: hypothetical protein AMK71_03635 [Nitrospira bacterium SG8_35_4]|nr:MAG: hypothetical protein AMK71_03635 [Nitrospira bacterium SG8_35_4]